MTPCTTCNICSRPGTLQDALEVRQIRSNVRQFRQQLFTVWRCANCGSLHSREAVDLGFYYRHYPVHQHRLDPVTRLGYRNRWRSLRRHGLTRETSILDYGCGQGVFVRYLRQQGYQVEGYDPYASQFADPSVLQQRYEVVVAYDVIEHVAEPRHLLQQMAGCLRPGGLLVIGTPAANQIDLTDPETFLLELHQPYHRHILSEAALLALAAQAGLEVVRVEYRFYFDTLVPFVNWRFGKAYVRQTGNMVDILMDRPRPAVVLTSPRLLFYAFAGYFFPPPGNVIVFFRRLLPPGVDSC